MTNAGLRIALLGQDIELRVVSSIIRAREVAEDVVFIDLSSQDETVKLAQEVDCTVLHYDVERTTTALAKFMLESDIDAYERTIFIHITDDWKLRDMALTVNRAKEDWDVHIAFTAPADGEGEAEQVVLSTADFLHIALTHEGMMSLAGAGPLATALDLPETLRVRVIQSKEAPRVPQRESLATASRFAQLFYWMLESKHPLILFGVPGIVLFGLGYKLSGNIIDTFNELNSTSIGVTLATIAMTLVGLFAMMVAIILYIMGKQVQQIQSQYDWPSRE